MTKLSIIGCGSRITDVFQVLLTHNEPVTIVAILDKDFEYAKKNLTLKEIDFSNAQFFTPDKIDDFFAVETDGVLIGTNCNTHTLYAEKVIKQGLPLFLEKPVSINEEQLSVLESLNPTAPVTVSFPMRVAPIAVKSREIIESGFLGKIVQIQAANNVAYGRSYYKKWYRDDSVTGGLFLQKATHDLDVIRYLLGGRTPEKLVAAASKVYYKGDKPKGIKCSECPEYKTCVESPWYLENVSKEPPQPENCAFAVDTGNQDSGTVIMLFDDGLHAVYTQNFVVRKDSGERLFRIIGSRGMLELSYYRNEIITVDYITGEKKVIEPESGEKHYGGDDVLTKNFLDSIKNPDSYKSTLKDGIISAKLCIASQRSSENNTFVNID